MNFIKNHNTLIVKSENFLSSQRGKRGAVLTSLLTFMRKSGETWGAYPSHSTIAYGACCHKTTVIDAIKHFVAEGYIKVTKRYKLDQFGQRVQDSNLYRLTNKFLKVLLSYSYPNIDLSKDRSKEINKAPGKPAGYTISCLVGKAKAITDAFQAGLKAGSHAEKVRKHNRKRKAQDATKAANPVNVASEAYKHLTALLKRVKHGETGEGIRKEILFTAKHSQTDLTAAWFAPFAKKLGLSGI